MLKVTLILQLYFIHKQLIFDWCFYCLCIKSMNVFLSTSFPLGFPTRVITWDYGMMGFMGEHKGKIHLLGCLKTYERIWTIIINNDFKFDHPYFVFWIVYCNIHICFPFDCISEGIHIGNNNESNNDDSNWRIG
jgi:hypothetical protein